MSLTPWPFWRMVTAVAIGRAHAPRPCALGLSSIKASLAGPESRFCHGLLDVHYVSSGPAVTAESGTVDAFLRACHVELAALGGEERAVLEPLRQAGNIGEDLIQSTWARLCPMGYAAINASDGIACLHVDDLAALRKPGVKEVLDAAYSGPRLQRSELQELLLASLRFSLGGDATEGAAHEQRLKAALEYWELLNLHGLQSVGSDLPTVGKALASGELVRFDATALLPEAAFNVTVASLAAAEGEGSRRIAVFPHAPHPPSSLAAFSKDLAKVRLPLGYTPAHVHHLVGYVNLRRLPRFAERVPDVVEHLHLADDVLHTSSILWIGPTDAGAWSPSTGVSCLHYDTLANVYVQLAGETDVLLVPPAYTDALDSSQKIFYPQSAEGWRDVLREGRAIGRVPFVLVHLRPGEGITLPSRTYHNFMAQGTDRVALNFWFHPRFKRMQYNATDLTSRSSALWLALRRVGVSAAQRVFEETGKAVFTDTFEYELI